MRVLVIGRGAREHALGWRLAKDASVSEVFFAPGNPGTAGVGRNLPVQETDADRLIEAGHDLGIDLVVIGPEAPLALGITDRLRQAGLTVFGPTREAARLEASKSFAKKVMASAGVPTAPYRVLRDRESGHRAIEAHPLPLVLKADGLAQGKGVFVADTYDAASDALETLMGSDALGDAGRTVLLERWLTGPEVSALAITDGADLRLLPLAQDHKRLGPGNTGPNTGGMGAITDLQFLGEEAPETIRRRILLPVLSEMRRRNTPFRGLLYAGLIWTDEGPQVLEFNVRFGDPEAEAILPGLEGDLADTLRAAATGHLGGTDLNSRPGVGVSVVAAAAGYPLSPRLGDVITGAAPGDGLWSPTADGTGALVFHAGTDVDERGVLRVAGGRVLCAAAWGATLPDARALAYDRLSRVSFAGMQVRPDIGTASWPGSMTTYSQGSTGIS